MKANPCVLWLRPVLFLLLALIAQTARATSVVAPTFEEMVEQSRGAFQGKVTEKSSRLEATDTGRRIMTAVVFQVIKTYKGEFDSPVTLDFLGGKVGDVEMHVEGMPSFAVGDTVVLFLDQNPEAACPVFAWTYGVYHVEPQTPQTPATVTGRTPLAVSSSTPRLEANRATASPVGVAAAVRDATSSTGVEAPVDLSVFEEALRAALAGASPKPSPTPANSP